MIDPGLGRRGLIQIRQLDPGHRAHTVLISQTEGVGWFAKAA